MFQFHIGIHFPKIAEMKDCCYFYRQRSSSVMHTHNLQSHFENMKILLSEYIQVRDKNVANPAVNIMDPQAKKEYFGFSHCWPKTTLPIAEKAAINEAMNIPNPIIK